MKCLNRQILDGEEMEVSKSNTRYQKIQLKFENVEDNIEREIANVPHLICIICYDAIGKDDSQDKNKNANPNPNPNPSEAEQSKLKEKVIHCSICEENHYVDGREWSTLFRKSCCAQCLII